MASENGDRLFYLAGGPLVALLLGVLLIPLRELTPASNLTFAFVALTILVAELGGTGPAVATALSSSFGLDFFLTRPYLRLAIEDKHDVVAFVGLTACGLVTAAAASHREKNEAALRVARAQQRLVRLALEQLERGIPAELGLSRVLEASRGVLPLAEALVQDTRGNILAATARARGQIAPSRRLETAWEPGAPDRGALLAEGVHVPLVARGRPVGWLDAWGNGKPARPGAWPALSDVARLLALLVAGPGTVPPPGAALPGIPPWE
jgi:hypothetical protein